MVEMVEQTAVMLPIIDWVEIELVDETYIYYINVIYVLELYVIHDERLEHEEQPERLDVIENFTFLKYYEMPKYYIYTRDWKIIASSTSKLEWLNNVVEEEVESWWHYRLEWETLTKLNTKEELNWTEFYVWIVDKELNEAIDKEWEDNQIKFKEEQKKLKEKAIEESLEPIKE